MFLFRSKKATMKEMQFATKAEAFAYMLKYQLEERKADPMTAAEKAGEFAEIFSQNMGVPEKLTPKPEGLDKYMAMADKVVAYCEDHPRVVEYIAGAATFLVGAIVGKKAGSDAPPPAPPAEPIDFDKLD